MQHCMPAVSLDGVRVNTKGMKAWMISLLHYLLCLHFIPDIFSQTFFKVSEKNQFVEKSLWKKFDPLFFELRIHIVPYCSQSLSGRNDYACVNICCTLTGSGARCLSRLACKLSLFVARALALGGRGCAVHAAGHQQPSRARMKAP